jgi:hypothetical protein
MKSTILLLGLFALVTPASAETPPRDAKPALRSAQSPVVAPTDEDPIVSKATVLSKLDTPFFHTTKTSYHWWIVEHESGKLEDTTDGSIEAEDLVRIEHTANCVSSHQGEHVMRFCEAVATADGVLLEFSGGMPAYASTLKITIGPTLHYKCSFEATYPAPINPLQWKVTGKELKLKRAEFAGGARVFGWLSVSFEEIDSVTKITKGYKIEGYFKPVLQHRKP